MYATTMHARMYASMYACTYVDEYVYVFAGVAIFHPRRSVWQDLLEGSSDPLAE